jgi:hypothetical protein
MHFVCGGLGFLSLIAATFVSAIRFAKRGEKAWGTFSVLTGVLFFAAFSGSPPAPAMPR